MGLVAAALLLTAAQATPSSPATQRKAAPSATELREKKGSLGELRQRIELLKKEMGSAESARTEVADQLKEQERAISDLQRDLHDLSLQRDQLRLRITELSQETQRAETELSGQQSQIERLLIQHYMTGTPGPLRLLLSGEDPNQLSRDLNYLSVIGQARQNLARQTATLIQEKKVLTDRAAEEAAALAALEARQRTQQEKMLARREDRKKTLALIHTRLDVQRREIDTLRRDEQRLTRLVDRLSKLIASRPKPAKPAKPLPKTAKTTTPDKKGQKTTPPAPANEPDHSGDTAESGHYPGLSQLKGRLPYPLAGSIGQRFGSPLDGGVRSKGIFVRSPNGTPVRAIAGGQVVFADWMRGFGNLLVIDHGNGFLSIYGYSEAVLKQVGDDVRANEAIATAGSTGGRSETGLYFELRRKGEPLDPGQWLRR